MITVCIVPPSIMAFRVQCSIAGWLSAASPDDCVAPNVRIVIGDAPPDDGGAPDNRASPNYGATPDNRRTQSVICTQNGHVLSITYDKVRELYFENPEFGFHFLRLTSQRLLQNVARLEAQLAKRQEAVQSAS